MDNKPQQQNFTIVLDDERIKRAKNIVEHISKLLSKKELFFEKSGLFEGEIGPAIFQFYCSSFFCSDTYSDMGFYHLSKSIMKLNTTSQSFSFADGLSGMVWALHHLKNHNFLSNSDTDIVGEDILLAIKRALSIDFRDKNYDLMYGYMGKSVVFREIGNNLEQIEHVCRELERNAIWEDNCCYWKDQDYPKESLINMGLAHGIPGIILFLLNAISSVFSDYKDWIFRIIEGAANWIAKQYNINIYSRFSTSVKIGQNSSHPSRLAWCYGDLGIAFMFIKLYHYTQNQKWQQEATNTIKTIYKRSIENSGIAINKQTKVLDTGFCHGTTGICYILRKLYIETGDNKLLEKTLMWLDISMENLERHLNINSIGTQIENNKFDFGLLNGITGSGLVILTFLNPTEKDWDRIFLLD